MAWKGDFGFSPENATEPAPVIGHEVKLINFNQLPNTPLSLQIQNLPATALVNRHSSQHQRVQPPDQRQFGPDGCAYIVDYGAVRDKGSDSHFVGAANGPLVQIPGTGVIWRGAASALGQMAPSRTSSVRSIRRKPLLFNANTQTKAFVASGRDLITFLFVCRHAADIRHEYTGFPRDIGTDVP
jgi:hypothetical protein